VKKRAYFVGLTILGCIFFFVGCFQNEKNDEAHSIDNHASFLATILEVYDSSILVMPNEGEGELRSADQISVSTGKAELYDETGNEISTSMFKQGMEVKIVYDGAIAESYPAQIHHCYEIQVITE